MKVSGMHHPEITIVSGPSESSARSATLQRALNALRNSPLPQGGFEIEDAPEFPIEAYPQRYNPPKPQFWNRPDADTAVRVVDGEKFVGLTGKEREIRAANRALWSSVVRADPDVPMGLTEGQVAEWKSSGRIVTGI